MRLTHIKLSGFKSFTDPTTIHVPGQLVAVIGPNGCGKSNVIDAVRWVLGEASAKQLRGESMQDVIFNGAATRRPAPRASVELVFDNSDHSLQGAWGQYAEVSIKRQLTRQGESTYFINNQTVRRRDITDLFLGTGVGARGYAVIEQGMISRIIEARPEELRAYIEEAAGVSKYKERRKETEGRLKDTREHLQRLGDLQNELARQVEKLEKQAETAERYKSLTAQLNQQQDLLDYAQWQQSLAAADKATAQHQSLQAQQDETAAQVQALNDEVHALQTAEQSQQQAVHELSNKRGVLREQIARLEEQIRHQQNLHQRIERDKQAAQAQMQRIHQEQQQIRVQLEENELQAEEKQTELAEWAMQVAEHEERLPELEEAQATLNAAFQTQQDEANRIRRELALKQQQLAHAEQTVAKHEERKGRLKQENQALNLPDEAETAAAQEAAALLQSQQEHYEEQIIAAEEALHAARETFQTASDRFQSLKQQHITLQAQQQALSQILSQQQEAADFWQTTDHAAAPQLWQHITAPAEWQHALSVILAERLHARAVPHGFVPPVPLPQGQAAWLSDDLSGGIKKSLPVQALLNQIQAQPPFQTALHHWLDGVLCAPDLSYALAHQSDLGAHQIWLTPEGHQVDKVSVLLYAKPAQESLIAQKARLDGIVSELDNLAPELSAAEAAFKQAEAAVRSSEVQHKNLMQQQQQHTRQYSQAQQRAAELLARTNQGQIRREHIERELAQLAEEQTVLQHTSDGLSDDIATLQEAAAELEHQQQTTAHSRQEQQGRLKQAQLALLEANRQYGLAEVAVHKLNQQKQNYQQQIARLEQQTLDWQERQQELALAYETEFQNDEQHIKLDELTEAVHTLDEEYIAVQDKLAQIQEQGREQYARVQTLQTKLPQLPGRHPNRPVAAAGSPNQRQTLPSKPDRTRRRFGCARSLGERIAESIEQQHRQPHPANRSPRCRQPSRPARTRRSARTRRLLPQPERRRAGRHHPFGRSHRPNRRQNQSAFQRNLRRRQRQSPNFLPHPVRRRRSHPQNDRRRPPDRRRVHHGAPARQEKQHHPPPLRRRKSPHRHEPRVRPVQPQPRPLLPSGRSRRPAGRRQHLAFLQPGQRNVGANPVPLHLPQPPDHGNGRAARRRNHAGKRRLARRRCGHQTGVGNGGTGLTGFSGTQKAV